MRLNDRGDALTLALGAAAFVGVSILIMAAVMMNLSSKGKRTRVQNEVDMVALSIGQLVSNRDLCATAFRMNGPGNPLFRFDPLPGPPAPAPGGVLFTAPIDRIYLGPFPGGRLQYCAEQSLATSPPECAAVRNPIVFVRGIQFTMLNNTANNRPINYLGDNTGRYRQFSGQIRIGSGVVIGRLPLGGVLQPRQVPIQVIVDTQEPAGPPVGGQIEMCYGTESSSQLCAELGGVLDPATGACTGILGFCERDPSMVCLPPPEPPAPTSCAPPELQWNNLYFAVGLDPSMRVRCACVEICEEAP